MASGSDGHSDILGFGVLERKGNVSLILRLDDQSRVHVVVYFVGGGGILVLFILIRFCSLWELLACDTGDSGHDAQFDFFSKCVGVWKDAGSCVKLLEKDTVILLTNIVNLHRVRHVTWRKCGLAVSSCKHPFRQLHRQLGLIGVSDHHQLSHVTFMHIQDGILSCQTERLIIMPYTFVLSLTKQAKWVVQLWPHLVFCSSSARSPLSLSRAHSLAKADPSLIGPEHLLESELGMGEATRVRKMGG